MSARIPTLFQIPLAPGDAVLVLGDTPLPPDRPAARAAPGRHEINCACCLGRSQIATALTNLLLARTRGETRWFNRVVILGSKEDWREVQQAIIEDRLAAARFEAISPT